MINIFFEQTGMITGTKFAIDLMDTNKGGRGGNVINISSVAGNHMANDKQ
jgi:NAD(P)-dependent dehydrogenase (short-subunit alcohol dehydrogenase family)